MRQKVIKLDCLLLNTVGNEIAVGSWVPVSREREALQFCTQVRVAVTPPDEVRAVAYTGSTAGCLCQKGGSHVVLPDWNLTVWSTGERKSQVTDILQIHVMWGPLRFHGVFNIIRRACMYFYLSCVIKQFVTLHWFFLKIPGPPEPKYQSGVSKNWK